ncbi:MAG: hypothetical protein JJT76_14650 [Clostridiaceae bacterium]|nr:hypothetical protein [Clostridiaceae bacterium]
MSEATNAYLVLLVLIIAIFYGIFKALQMIKLLGKLQYKVGTKYQLVSMAFFSLYAILFAYRWISTVEHREMSYKLQIVLILAGLGVYLVYSICLSYMNGEIRENGIIIGSTAFKWDEIRHFKLTCEDTITIDTNKKSLVNKEGKEVRWRINKKKAHKLREILSQYAEEIK